MEEALRRFNITLERIAQRMGQLRPARTKREAKAMLHLLEGDIRRLRRSI